MAEYPPSTTNSFSTLQPSSTFEVSGPLSLGSLLDRAFRIYRNQFGKLLLTAAIFLVPLGVVTGLLTGNFMTGYLGIMENVVAVFESPSSEPEFDEIVSAFTPFIGFFGIYFLLAIVGFVLQGIVTLALTAHSLALVRGKSLSMREGIAVATNRLIPFIGKSVVQWLIIAGATLAILMFFACAIGLLIFGFSGTFAFFDGPFESSSEPSVVALIGFFTLLICLYLFAILFVLIPTFYLSGRYIAATVGIVDQNWGAVESLRNSWALTKGRIWRCIGYFILLGILTLLIIQLPIGIAQNIVQLFVGFEMIGVITGVFAAATSLMTVLWTPFQVAALVLFYLDLRVRQENYDLELRLEQLEESA